MNAQEIAKKLVERFGSQEKSLMSVAFLKLKFLILSAAKQLT